MSDFHCFFSIAGPSCVWPAGLEDNCIRLAGLAAAGSLHEAGLYLMQSGPCLAYGPGDLPDALADLPLAYHLHLPVDLPWDKGFEAVAAVLSSLVAKTAHLRPRRHVLHPPAGPAGLDCLRRTAALLRDLSIDPATVCIENVPGHDLVPAWEAIVGEGFSVCVDLGHLLAFGQERLLELPGLAQRLAMLHLHAPEMVPAPRDAHLPITALDAVGRSVLGRLLDMARPDATLVAEVFSPSALQECLEGIHTALAERSAAVVRP